MALAHQRPAAHEPEAFSGERRLAVQLIKQAAQDLDNGRQRRSAAKFLTEDLPGSVWHAWLDGELDVPAVRAFVQAKLGCTPKRAGIKLRRDGRESVAD